MIKEIMICALMLTTGCQMLSGINGVRVTFTYRPPASIETQADLVREPQKESEEDERETP